MQERPPSGSRGGEILFDIFEAEGEVFHQAPLYPFERCETRPTGTSRQADTESHCSGTPEPLQFRVLAGITPIAVGGLLACGIRTQPGARTLQYNLPLVSRGNGE